MSLTCPVCKTYKLSYKERVILLPVIGWSVTCKSCDEIIGATVISELLFMLLLIVVNLIGIRFLLDLNFRHINFFTAFIISNLILCVLVWPLILRLRKCVVFKPYIPKSRFVGYLIYLIFPIFLIISVFFFAVKYQWGV